MAGWFESRSGGRAALREFLGEKMPASVGWKNTLGSLAGALLLVQIVTGILLMLYYVPHPEAAYTSLEWMAKNVTLGALVRALHYWGASFVIVAVAVHMLRVVVTGAYRAPRELNWLTGLALFGVVITLAYTGQLLPYNQMGYWAGAVGIEIASSAPFIGPEIRALMMGGDTVGALTLTRFYALHVVVLPALLGVLVMAHLYLLRKHGPARAASDTAPAVEPFYPMQFLRDMVVISGGLAALLLTAQAIGGPHSGPLDLSDTSYQPRPEWYFLAHFELLRLTQGGFQKMLVAFALPSALLLALAALPWIDRGRSAAPRDRKPVVAAVLVLAFAFAGLTAYSTMRHPPDPGNQPMLEADAAPAPEAGAGQDEIIALGARTFRQLQCFKCHVINGEGSDIGPDLTLTGRRLHEPFLREWLKDPKALKPQTIMPPMRTSPEKFEAVVAYLMSLREPPAPTAEGDGAVEEAAQ